MKKPEQRSDVIPVMGHAKRRAYATADAYLEKHMRIILDEYAADKRQPLDEIAWHIEYLAQQHRTREFKIDEATFRVVLSKQARASRPNEAQSPPRYVNAQPEKSRTVRERFQRFERAIREVVANRLGQNSRKGTSQDFGLGD